MRGPLLARTNATLCKTCMSLARGHPPQLTTCSFFTFLLIPCIVVFSGVCRIQHGRKLGCQFLDDSLMGDPNLAGRVPARGAARTAHTYI